ncbi:MAG: chemotaxis protein CheW [Pseudomonadota bacterium]
MTDTENALAEHASEDEAAPTDQVELLSFSVAGQDYAIDIMRVREIRNWSKPTPLPRTPDYVRGVINLRGTVLPILDLANRLGLEDDGEKERTVFVVIKDGARLFGVTVDGVSDILTVSKEALLDPPALADGGVESCVSSLILEEDRMIRVLAVDTLAPGSHAAASEVNAA